MAQRAEHVSQNRRLEESCAIQQREQRSSGRWPTSTKRSFARCAPLELVIEQGQIQPPGAMASIFSQMPRPGIFRVGACLGRRLVFSESELLQLFWQRYSGHFLRPLDTVCLWFTV